MFRGGLFCYPMLANLPRARWWLQLLRDTHSSPTLLCSVPNKRTTTPLPAVPWEWGQSGKFTSDSLSPKGLTLRISIYDRSIFFSMIDLLWLEDETGVLCSVMSTHMDPEPTLRPRCQVQVSFMTSWCKPRCTSVGLKNTNVKVTPSAQDEEPEF